MHSAIDVDTPADPAGARSYCRIAERLVGPTERRSAAASEDLAHAGSVEVLEETLDLSPPDMDDEADGCCDEIAGLELSMQDVALNEPTTKELPGEHLVSTL